MAELDEELVTGVIETIDGASTQRYKLDELMDSIKEAETQVKTSADKSKEDIENHFRKCKENFTKLIEEREAELLDQIFTIENEALEPLSKCRDVIKDHIGLAQKTLAEGKKILSGQNTDKQSISDFKKVDEKLNSLPAVPMLSEVICMYTELPGGFIDKCREDLQHYGKVISQPPVQICETSERHAAQLLKWHQAEDDYFPYFTEYRLQFCPGENYSTVDTSEFKDIYEGPLTCYTVRHLNPMAMYSFRVCGRVEGGQWCHWSVPTAVSTSLHPYVWDPQCVGYTCSNEGKISTCTSDGSSVHSCGDVLYECGHNLVFKVLEVGGEEDGIQQGMALLTSKPKNDATFMDNGILLVTANGCVYVNGRETTNKLPALTRGCRLSFDTEQLSGNKIRVTISTNHKAITLDWTLDTAPCKLHFAIKFEKDWKICVE